MPRIVLGLCGLAGSGKTTAAVHLVSQFGYQRIRFADPLKDMLRYGIGLTDTHIEGELKEIPLKALCGKSPRWAMQSLGTQWGRDCIGEQFWVNAWLRRVEESDPDKPIVADDVRF